MLKVIEYIKEHGLAKTLVDFKLKAREYDDKVLIKYSQVDSDMSLSEVQDSRGLILERDTWKILCLTFRKFFNSAEGHAARIDWNTAHVLEKLDGSLIQVYWDWNNEKWFAATTGTGEGEGEVNNKFGTTFNELFWGTVNNKYSFNDCLLDKDHVYAFELTTPYNIVVKPHGESSATLLAARNRVTLEEIGYVELGRVADSLGVPLVKAFDLNIDNAGALIRTFENMPWSEEGYVVVDGKFNRVKIKNPAYVAVHHLKSKTSEHAIMEVVKTNEIDEFISTFPERAEEITRLYTNYIDLKIKLEAMWEVLKDKKPKNITAKEKKKFAMAVFESIKVNEGDFKDVKSFSGLFFALNDRKVESVSDYLKEYDNKRLYLML